MPSDKKTPPAGPRRTGAGVSQRPASPTTPRSGATDNTRSNAPLSQPPGKGPVRRDRNEPPRRSGWKNVWENIGWGLVIGLPVILVILAILWRATNGFTATSDSRAPVPTAIPTVTAGVYVAPPAANAAKNRLVYLQSPTLDAPQQVFTSNLDGSNPFQVTNSVQNKAGAVWSPDGKQIAFTADNAGVELVNFDGTGLHTVAYTGYNPVFSPDGKQIAFIKNLPAPDGQGPDGIGIVRVLFVTNVNAKPGEERQLASDAPGHNWSPDGKQIAFFSLRNAVMFTVDVASGTTTQIKLPDKLGAWYPTWSPDGNSFVFYGDPNPSLMVSALDLAVAAANTSTVDSPLLTATAAASATTAAPTTVSSPVTATTPAGTTAAFGTPTAGPTPSVGVTVSVGTPAATAAPSVPSQISLYMVNKDGSNLKKLQDLEPVGGGGKFRFDYYVATSADVVSTLTSRPSFKVGPVFSPDGKSVSTLYVGEGDKIGLAVIHPDGTPTTLVVEGQNNLPAGIRLNPAFSGDSSKLLYTFTPPNPTGTGSTPTPAVTNTLASQQLKEGRYFDLNAKTEKSIFPVKADTTFLNCCGVGK